MLKKDTNSLKKMQVMLLTDLDENVMMDLLASTSVYVNHVKQNSIENAEQIASDVYLTDDEKNLQLSFLNDDINSAKEAMELAEELAIIGLYKTIELRITKSARASGLFSNNKIKELSALGTLIDNFNAIGIDLNSIQHFNEFKELKLINNGLKHTGEVNIELASINPKDWIKGQQLSNADQLSID